MLDRIHFDIIGVEKEDLNSAEENEQKGYEEILIGKKDVLADEHFALVHRKADVEDRSNWTKHRDLLTCG